MRTNSLAVVFLAVGLLVATALIAGAQSGAFIPQGGAGHANHASCMILKRMGPADEVTSHLYSFGFRGKQKCDFWAKSVNCTQRWFWRCAEPAKCSLKWCGAPRKCSLGRLRFFETNTLKLAI